MLGLLFRLFGSCYQKQTIFFQPNLMYAAPVGFFVYLRLLPGVGGQTATLLGFRDCFVPR